VAPVVTLLTDYGPGSEHVGALHAVLVARCPGATRVDLAHDVPPGQVRWAALQLARLAPLLPSAVHLAVVDPGVGTGRRALAVTLAGGGALVGPDNGLLGPAARALGAVAAHVLTAPPGAPATFHGRDVFAPAAAALAAGRHAATLGPPVPVASIATPPMPAPGVAPGVLRAEVAGADRFGNVALLAGAADLVAAGLGAGAAVRVSVDDGAPVVARVGRAFADVPRGEVLVHVDSHGQVAVAVREGDAAARLGAGPGRTIRITAVDASTKEVPSRLGRGREPLDTSPADRSPR